MFQSLHSFFTEIATREGTPFAMRVIREKTGLTTRDDNPDDVVLPPHLSRHRCYAQWVYSRGWIPKKKNRTLSMYTTVEEFDPRPHDDDQEIPLWPQGSERKRICCWTTFHTFWENNYSHIKIRKRGADTCTDCLIFLNSMKAVRVNESSESSSEEDNEELVEGAIQAAELNLSKAKKHVVQYQMQRAASKFFYCRC